MKRITAIFTALAAMALLFSTSCTKPDLEIPVVYLDVNASNLHGNWQLEAINGAAVEEGTIFYINFNRSGEEFKIWENLTSIPSSYNYSEGTFSLYTDPVLGVYIRGVDNVKVEWSDLYVIRELTKNRMVWVGVNDPTFTQTFHRVSAIPFAN